jgi:hypothetical protein
VAVTVVEVSVNVAERLGVRLGDGVGDMDAVGEGVGVSC